MNKDMLILILHFLLPGAFEKCHVHIVNILDFDVFSMLLLTLPEGFAAYGMSGFYSDASKKKNS